MRVNGILIGLVESGQWRRRFEAREDQSQDWATWSAQLAKTKHIPLGRLGQPIEGADPERHRALSLALQQAQATGPLSLGEQVELSCPDVADLLPRLLSLSVPLTGMQVRSPNLEDLFLHLTGHSLRSGA